MGEGTFPERLRDLLPSVGADVGLNDAVGVGSVWAQWEMIVGEQISAHAEPTSLRDGVLRVRTESPSWATEIGYLAGEITRRVNELVGREVVLELKVWTGPGAVTRRKQVQADRKADGMEEHPQGSIMEDPKAALGAAREAWEKRRRAR